MSLLYYILKLHTFLDHLHEALAQDECCFKILWNYYVKLLKFLVSDAFNEVLKFPFLCLEAELYSVKCQVRTSHVRIILYEKSNFRN